MAKDLICGMDVDEESAQWTSEYEGKTYYFCSPGCKSTFESDPMKYVSGEGGHSGHEHGMGH